MLSTVANSISSYKSTKLAFLSSETGALLAASRKGFQRPGLSRCHSFGKCYVTQCVLKQKGFNMPSKQPFLRDVQLLGIVPFIPNWVLLGLYGYLGFRFFSGFEQTTYSKNSRLLLSILWPVMFIVNDRFRKNFKKALKQGEDE